MYVCVCMCTYVCGYVCMYVCIYVCMYVCMYAHIVYIYVHAHIKLTVGKLDSICIALAEGNMKSPCNVAPFLPYPINLTLNVAMCVSVSVCVSM